MNKKPENMIENDSKFPFQNNLSKMNSLNDENAFIAIVRTEGTQRVSSAIEMAHI